MTKRQTKPIRQRNTRQPALQGYVNGIHIPGAWVAIAMQFIALLMVGAQGWQRLITTEATVAKLEAKIDNWVRSEMVSREKFASLETKLDSMDKQLDKLTRQLEIMNRQKYNSPFPIYPDEPKHQERIIFSLLYIQ